MRKHREPIQYIEGNNSWAKQYILAENKKLKKKQNRNYRAEEYNELNENLNREYQQQSWSRRRKNLWSQRQVIYNHSRTKQTNKRMIKSEISLCKLWDKIKGNSL